MKFHRTMTQIPVADVEKSVKLIERLGFIPFYQDIDPNGTAMLLSPYASVMLMEKRRFERAAQRPVSPTDTSEVVVSIVVDDRRDVDRLVDRALAGGAREHGEMQDIGTMYQRGFLDFDSHHWKII